VSDLLEAASDALGAPAELVRRSAAARASANGTTVDDILAAWSGGAPVVSAPPATEMVEEPAPAEEPSVEETPEPEAAAVAVIDEPALPEPIPSEVVDEPEPDEELEPVPLRIRLRAAVRIGSWVGAALGVVGFLITSGFWAPNAAVLPEGGPVVVVSPSSILIGIALASLVFGAVVAGMSRAAVSWTNPAMGLSGSKTVTVWIGAVVGLVLGVAGGALLSGLGTAVEGSDPPMTQLPVLATLLVMVFGGAILGGITAVVPQLLAVPVAVAETEQELVTIRHRLGNALSIPLAGLILLLVLVLPFAYALIQSNHLAENGGAIVAVIAAAGILGFSALAGNRPQMRISLGDLVVALIGIGVVLLIIITVLFYIGSDEHDGEPVEEAHPVMQLV